jgi:hypothetical protein
MPALEAGVEPSLAAELELAAVPHEELPKDTGKPFARCDPTAAPAHLGVGRSQSSPYNS